MNITGRVYLQFVVDEQGNVVDPVVTRPLGGGTDEAAIEAIRTAKFKPGKQRGKPVKVQYSMFVTFQIR
jgi:protein TonB